MYIIVGGLLVAILLLLLIGFGFKYLIDRTEEQAAQLQSYKETQALLLNSIDTQKAALEEWEEASKEWQEAIDELTENDRLATAELRRLHNVFQKHDLTKLSKRKPTLIEKRLNNGTNNIVRLLEDATDPSGSDLRKAK